MIRIADLVCATGGRLAAGDARAMAAGFCYDSRLAEPGELFVAVVTDTGDGHEFIDEAIARGAVAVMCQRLPAGPRPDAVSWVLVDDTQQALLDYAGWVLASRQVEVIGITGSVGKSGTKEAIAAVLAQREPVFKNPGSFNGRYGLPIALGRLAGERLAVLEMASDSLDEIKELAALAHPRVGVVTRVGHSHVADLGGLENIAAEKVRLVQALPPEGLAVLNGDDARVLAMAEQCRCRVITIGLNRENTYWADAVSTGLTGTVCTLHDGGSEIALRIPWTGQHHAYTMMFAYAVGREYGLEPAAIAQGLLGASALPGRLSPVAGYNGSVLLDDTFNASPESFEAALSTLSALPARRRWVIMGEMADLGPQSEEWHRRIGSSVAGVADRLVTKGDLAALAAGEAQRAGMPSSAVQVSYADAEIVGSVLSEIGAGDAVLIKGSASARLENVTRGLMAHPEEAAARLARQNRGWQAIELRRPGRPTWVEIDLAAIAGNTRQTASLLAPGVELMAVLKADAYGHGARRVARTVLRNGASWLGVACLGEGIELRDAGIDAPILNLGFTPAWQAREAVRHDIVSTVFSLDVARALARAGRDLGHSAAVHVKVDTGMGRLGLAPSDVMDLIRDLAGMEGLDTQGLFSHLAAADEEDQGYTDRQLALFDTVVRTLREQGLLPRKVHIANSAATLRRPDSHYNMVRAGIILYGLAPSAEVPLPEGYRPAMAFKCQVAQVRDVPAGSCIGYGCTFVAGQPMRIAVIPVGYADGFRRGPRHWGHVLIRGQHAPLVGRVCMDQTMVDVTHIPAATQGDEVVLIGTQGAASLSAEAVAAQLGTINYEVVSEILARVPRVV